MKKKRKGIEPIKLGKKPSDEYIKYAKRILHIKWSEPKPVAVVLLEALRKEIQNLDLHRREKAKLLQQIVLARTFVHKFSYPEERTSWKAMAYQPSVKDILEAYGKKKKLSTRIKEKLGLL